MVTSWCQKSTIHNEFIKDPLLDEYIKLYLGFLQGQNTQISIEMLLLKGALSSLIYTWTFLWTSVLFNSRKVEESQGHQERWEGAAVTFAIGHQT